LTPQVVADCSACGGWYIQDESSKAAENLLERILKEEIQLVVPDLWWYESLNLLRSATARRRISEQASRRAFFHMEEIPIETIRVDRIGRARILDIAQRNTLSAYDATYLALAESMGIPLITNDRQLLDLRSRYPWIEPSDTQV